jgi:hypothetical protein
MEEPTSSGYGSTQNTIGMFSQSVVDANLQRDLQSAFSVYIVLPGSWIRIDLIRIRIRIHKVTESGSNPDPDPQPWF